MSPAANGAAANDLAYDSQERLGVGRNCVRVQGNKIKHERAPLLKLLLLRSSYLTISQFAVLRPL